MNFRKRLGGRGVLRGLEHAAAGDGDERARVLVLEVVRRDVLGVLAGLGLVAVVVVVVDQGGVHLAGVDGLHGRAVALVGLGVLLHALEPFLRGGLALEFAAGPRRSPGSRRRTATRPSGPSTRAWPGPAWTWAAGPRSAWPCRRRARWSGPRCRSTCPWTGRNSAGTWSSVALSTSANRPAFSTCVMAGRVLGEEDVGRRGGALLHDLVGHLGVVAVAHGDLDAGLLREGSTHSWVRLSCCAL